MVEADRLQHDLKTRGDAARDRIFALLHAFGRDRIGSEQPQGDGDAHDDRARAAQEQPGALPQADPQVADRRKLVARQFHHEAAALALGRGATQHEGGGDRADDAEDIEAEQHQALQPHPPADAGRRNERADDDGIDREPRRTGHQRCDQDRGQPFLGIVDRARGHDAGNRAGEGRQQRNECPPRQADPGHQPIHQQCRADHIARRLEDQDEQEQDHDLGQEHHHRSDAVDDPFDQQVAQEAFGQGRRSPLRQPALEALDPADRRFGPGEHRLEHDEHDRGKDHRSGNGVQHHAVDGARKGAAARLIGDRRLRNATCLTLIMGDIRIGRGGRFRPGREQGAGERRAQFVEPALAHRDGADHGHAEFGRQRIGVDGEAVARRHVDHVERNHHRPAELTQLEHESQVIFDVRGIGDHDQRVGQAFAVLLAQHDVAGHRFVRAGGIEAVGTGKVDQFDRTAVVERHAAGVTFHGDAGIVADFLSRAGERIEQGGLAGIGVADQSDERGLVHAEATSIASVTCRRSATVIRPMRTAAGPPSQPFGLTSSTSTPSSRPNSRRRRASEGSSAFQSIDATVAGTLRAARARGSLIMRAIINKNG
eukprot:Opistho-1_new@24325